MRNILFLWIIIGSLSVLLTIHIINSLWAFPLQANFQSLLHWCKPCCSKHAETVSLAPRFLSRAPSWWHTLSQWWKLLLGKEEKWEKERHKRKRKLLAAAGKAGEEQAPGPQAAPAALATGGGAAAGGRLREGWGSPRHCTGWGPSGPALLSQKTPHIQSGRWHKHNNIRCAPELLSGFLLALHCARDAQRWPWPLPAVHTLNKPPLTTTLQQPW